MTPGVVSDSSPTAATRRTAAPLNASYPFTVLMIFLWGALAVIAAVCLARMLLQTPRRPWLALLGLAATVLFTTFFVLSGLDKARSTTTRNCHTVYNMLTAQDEELCTTSRHHWLPGAWRFINP